MTPRYMRLSETKEAYEVYKEKQRLRHQEKIKSEREVAREETINGSDQHLRTSVT